MDNIRVTNNNNAETLIIWHGKLICRDEDENRRLEECYQAYLAKGKNAEEAERYTIQRYDSIRRSKEKAADVNDLKNYLQQELGLAVNSQGWPLQTFENYRHMMADVLGLDMRYNELTGRMEIGGRPWQDDDLSDIWGRMSDMTKGYLENKNKIYDTFVNCARSNSYHPIKDYIGSLEWDGVKRLPYIFEEVFGCEKGNRLYQAYADLFFMGAVKRLYKPGCKFENMLILQGAQGYGKTLFWRRLVKGNTEWLNDGVNIERVKDANDSVSQTWFVIFEELASWSKADARDMKDYLGKQEDQYRKAYGREQIIAPRHCVFCGNTNDDHFLKDTDLFERRYWVVEINNPDNRQAKRLLEKMTDEYVDQIWAEAYVYYTKFGDKPLMLNDILYDEQRRQQRKYKTTYEAIPTIEDIVNCEYSDRINEYEIQLYKEYNGLDPVLGSEKKLRDEFRTGSIKKVLRQSHIKYPKEIIKMFVEYTADESYSGDRWEIGEMYVKRNKFETIRRVKKDTVEVKQTVSDYISDLLDISEVKAPVKPDNISNEASEQWSEFENSGEIALLKLNTVDIFN